MSPRRVVIGTDAQDIPLVVSDAEVPARTVRPNGAVVQELWRQETLPALADTVSLCSGEIESAPPPSGASVRLFTLPGVSSLTGSGPRAPITRPAAGTRGQSLFIATVLSGQAVLVLESCDVRLDQGDTLVLPGTPHDWRNDTEEPASIVTTVFALGDESPSPAGGRGIS